MTNGGATMFQPNSIGNAARPQTPDYPAAHSADTEWFAVDREGRVGRFVTLESGTLPVAAGELDMAMVRQAAEASGHHDRLRRFDDLDGCGEAQADLVDAELRAQDARSDVVYNVRACLTGEHSWNGLFAAGGEAEGGFSLGPPVATFRRRRLGPVVGIVKDLELVQGLLDLAEAGLALQTPPGPPYVVVFQNLASALAKELIGSGQCFSLRSPPDRNLPVCRGLFHYVYNSWGGPYVCQLIPASPVRVDRFSSGIRDLVARVGFANLSFTETSFIQPTEHVPCANRSSPRRIQKELVKCRTELESRSPATFQPQPDPVDGTDAPVHPAWTRQLLDAVEGYREAEPTRFKPDLVRVSLAFDSPGAALEVLRTADAETDAEAFVLRGPTLVCLDQGITNPSSAYDRRFSPDDVYAWLGRRIESGRFRAPEISLGRPPVWADPRTSGQVLAGKSRPRLAGVDRGPDNALGTPVAAWMVTYHGPRRTRPRNVARHATINASDW
jgi:hypothetical protein